METDKYSQILEDHNIRPTANRIVVARQLTQLERPISLAELEATIGTIDKSNILRTLNIFKDNHLVHVIEGGEGFTLYEICQSHHHCIDDDDDDDAHIHFFCENCHQTICLNEKHIPKIELPEGYTIHSANFMLKGICPKCMKKR